MNFTHSPVAVFNCAYDVLRADLVEVMDDLDARGVVYRVEWFATLGVAQVICHAAFEAVAREVLEARVAVMEFPRQVPVVSSASLALAPRPEWGDVPPQAVAR